VSPNAIGASPAAGRCNGRPANHCLIRQIVSHCCCRHHMFVCGVWYLVQMHRNRTEHLKPVRYHSFVTYIADFCLRSALTARDLHLSNPKTGLTRIAPVVFRLYNSHLIAVSVPEQQYWLDQVRRQAILGLLPCYETAKRGYKN
jgi:hypothetical protein